MTPEIDIHGYEKRYETQRNQVKKATISMRNKKLILEFEQACQLEGLSKPRRIKLLSTLKLLAERLARDFDKATKEDLKSIVLDIGNRPDYSPWTKQNYRSILKRFYKWLAYGDDHRHTSEYPKIVAWINTNLKIREQPKVKAADLLEEKEIDALIRTADNNRDKAFLSMLYELGARIGEIGNLNLGSITRDRYSFLVDLEGKTGRRVPRVILSTNVLSAWLNQHPAKDNPVAPLWPMRRRRQDLSPMKYGALRLMVQRTAKRAGIKKRVYPHLFRHTRVTHLLANRQISEAQAKVYFGWTPSSKMLSEYVHLVSSDVNSALLEVYGIKEVEGNQGKAVSKQCPTCSAANSGEARFCYACGNVLDMGAGVRLDEELEGAGKLVKDFLEIPGIQKLFKEMVVKKYGRPRFSSV